MIRRFLSLTAVALCMVAASAQDESFDLSSQRGEVQVFNKVPGHKVDHQGLIINPTPHSLTRHDATLDASAGFKLTDKQHRFADDVDFLNLSPNGVKLTIDFGAKAAKKAGVKAVDGAYRLVIDPKGVTITGYDERGAFYGLMTLRQILDSPAAKDAKLPQLVINDYPDLPYRGVVEGFYGTPWSHQVRLSLIDFYGKHKMNNYLYGPKDDPYHSSPNWRQPYPDDQAKNIRELVDACKKARVNFIWAIHPGKDIRWNKEDYDSLVAKFNMMYDLGVRSFAIFFDDIEGEGTNPRKQVELLNDLTNDFVKTKGDVTNLMVCPTDYSRLWANPTADGPLAVYGRDLDKRVEVFYTGDVVCSDMTHDTMNFVNTLIQRPALFWWNFPVTDYCRHILLQGPVYGLDPTLTPAEVAGLESNPMEHGEASKLALYGVADYTWNMADYNAIDNWERGLEYMMPHAAEAYRTFAIHSTDTETGYRRDESWETETFTVDNFTAPQFYNLRDEFAKICAAPRLIEKNCDNELLKNELRPWLAEFGKLGARGLRTLDLITTATKGDSIFWEAYIANLMSPADRDAYNAHKSGTMKLQPFYENAMDDLLRMFYERLAGTKPMLLKGVGSYPNSSTTLTKQMLDNNLETFYTSGYSQGEGDWIGVDLGQVRPVHNIEIHQGRNSVDDCDYFDHTILEISADGKTWTALTEPMKETYDIIWSGTPQDARYARLRRLESPRTNWASIRTFAVNAPTHQSVGLNIDATQPDAALLAFDENPMSTYTLDGSLTFDRPAGAKSLTLLLLETPSQPLTINQYDSRGKLLSSTTATSAYYTAPLVDKTARIAIEGTALLGEALLK